jgi:2-phosphosulfolactate phosphatase
MIDVLLTPSDHPRIEAILPQSQVVILDVLRATSTIVTTLHAGAKEVRLFDSLDAARSAKSEWPPAQGPVALAGEKSCLKPGDFDLGNSPREHVTHKVGNATVLLATTNGTRAAVRVQAAARLYAASLLNAAATAKALLPQIESLHTLLVCAGTNGALALEDVIGAGAILFSLLQTTYRTDLAFTDSAWLAYHAFAAVRQRLPAALRLGAGGINVIEAGLEEDIDACALLDSVPLVATVHTDPLRVLKSA